MSLHAAVFKKLAEKFGGVAELSAFGKHEQRRLENRAIRTAGSRFSPAIPRLRIPRPVGFAISTSFGPTMVEITAAGWVRASAAAVRS